MSPAASRFAKAAEALEEAPFRLHGRSPETGVDCVGLVICALAACGLRAASPHGYGLRNSLIEHHLAFAAANGFGDASGAIRRGDVLLVSPGPAQQHLLVASGDDLFVHAHAGIGRVVRDCGLGDAPLLHHWRLRP